MNLIDIRVIEALLKTRHSFLKLFNFILLSYIVNFYSIDVGLSQIIGLVEYPVISTIFLFVLVLYVVKTARTFISSTSVYIRGETSISVLENHAIRDEKFVLLKTIERMKFNHQQDNRFYSLCGMAFLLTITVLLIDKVQGFLLVHWYLFLPLSIFMFALLLAGTEPDKNDSTRFYFDTDLRPD